MRVRARDPTIKFQVSRFSASNLIAVEKALANLPPHRSVRAQFRHTALTALHAGQLVRAQGSERVDIPDWSGRIEGPATGHSARTLRRAGTIHADSPKRFRAEVECPGGNSSSDSKADQGRPAGLNG